MAGFQVRKVAVLGAGVMGAQIAAQLVNVNVPVVLFDLASKEGDKHAVVKKAIDNLKKLKPTPLAQKSNAMLLKACNYEENLEELANCDLIIEAIAERMDWKLDLYTKIAPHVAPHAILASNTSGLSLTQLSQALPESLRPRFCGVHFFNPPRYMYLAEIISIATTNPEVLDNLETFATSVLGKGVVRAFDTPNFVANRVGVAGILSVMYQAKAFGLSYDIVDDLTGKKLGRASSGTYRTADVVGLDTLEHVFKTMQSMLNTETDPYYGTFVTPQDMKDLLQMGALGQKTGAGYFKKEGKDILRFNPATKAYEASGAKADDAVAQILRKPPTERIAALRESQHPQAQFVWAVLRDHFHYCALHLHSIAETARDIDLAIRWGFGYSQGPFELWQEAGWLQVAQWIDEDIQSGKAPCKTPLPQWVFNGIVAQAQGVHTAQGSYSAKANAFLPKRKLAVYERQIFPQTVFGSGQVHAQKAGQTVFEDDAIRLWTLDSQVLLMSFKTKMHTMSAGVIEGLNKAVEIAEKQYQGLVIWQPQEPFSAGADLQMLMPAFQSGGAAALDSLQAQMQQAMLRVRYASVPVVAAMAGLVLGGGCELAVSCARRVAAQETYIGLPEAGVGIIPGAGGSTYLVRRASERAQGLVVKDLLPLLSESFMNVATGKVSSSAQEGRELGYLLYSDVIVPNKEEVLFVAINETKALAQSGYRAPLARPIVAAGEGVFAAMKAQISTMQNSGAITAHDALIATQTAWILTGGDVPAGAWIDEAHVLTLERKALGLLVATPQTQERIAGMLKTGKPVRN